MMKFIELVNSTSKVVISKLAIFMYTVFKLRKLRIVFKFLTLVS